MRDDDASAAWEQLVADFRMYGHGLVHLLTGLYDWAEPQIEEDRRTLAGLRADLEEGLRAYAQAVEDGDPVLAERIQGEADHVKYQVDLVNGINDVTKLREVVSRYLVKYPDLLRELASGQTRGPGSA